MEIYVFPCLPSFSYKGLPAIRELKRISKPAEKCSSGLPNNIVTFCFDHKIGVRVETSP